MKNFDKFIIKNHDNNINIKNKKLDSIIDYIKLAAKFIQRDINNINIIKKKHNKIAYNIHHEQQNIIDLHAHKIFKLVLQYHNDVAGILSEEEENFIIFSKKQAKNGNFIILLDPLDGSSNFNTNVTIGSIFSAYKRVTKLGDFITNEDFLQPGYKQIIAGYIIYSHALILVYTTGNGVNCFTYEPSLGTFYLTNKNIKFPIKEKNYSINEGNYNKFNIGIKKYIHYCQTIDQNTSRPYTSRYIGSLIADFHRNLINGGVYIYPNTVEYPNGKLRLLYECNPLSFIAEQAGGKASNGVERILNIKPKFLHQRTSFIVGIKSMVNTVEKFYI